MLVRLGFIEKENCNLSNTFDQVSLMVSLIKQLAFLFFIPVSQYYSESAAEDSVFALCLQSSKYSLYADQCRVMEI